MKNRHLKIVLAPDKFGGWKSALEIADIMADVIRRYFSSGEPNDSGVEIIRAPMADGGAGTIEVVEPACGGRRITVPGVLGPLGEPIAGSYLYLNGETVLIEMAAASGMHHLRGVQQGPDGWSEVDRRDPLKASTFGTGQLIAHAVQTFRPRRVIVSIGGAATNDGGIGCLQALGVDFIAGDGSKLSAPAGGSSLRQVHGVRTINAINWQGVECLVACDVNNRLLGPQGATAVYGPQKGVTVELLNELEEGMRAYSNTLEEWVKTNRADRERVLIRHGAPATSEFRELAGTGAGGGISYGLLCFCPATLQPGAELVARLIDLPRKIQGADLVITGEGRIDRQTLSGKVPLSVARIAAPFRREGAFVAAVAGAVEPGVSWEDYSEMFDTVADSSSGRELSLPEIQNTGESNLRRAVERVLDTFLHR